MTTATLPRKYLGFAGHFIASDSCRFHIATEIGDVLVSTVGAYVPKGGVRDRLREGEKAGDVTRWEEIGCNRLFETFVFRLSDEPCGCGDCTGRRVLEWGEIDSRGYNSAREAEEGHEAMCQKWAQTPQPFDAEGR